MAREYTPEELGIKPEREYTLEELEKMSTPQSGGIASFKSSLYDITGQGALTLGKVGLMNPEEAQRKYEENKQKSASIYAPTEKGWTEDPLGKVSELLGGSVPYMVAPLAGAALANPVGAGLLGAGAVSAGQFVGSNLGRQLDEVKKEGKNLADTSLTSAVAAAVPQALLDTYALKMTPLIRGIFGKAGKEITEKTAEQIAQKGILGTITQTGLTANREGLTEAGQQVLERLQAGLNIADEEAKKEYFDSYIGGAVLGGVLGAGGHFIEKSMQNTAENRYDSLMNDLRTSFDSASDVPMTDVINKITELTGEKDLNKIQNFLGGAQERGHLETIPNEDDTFSVKFKQPTPMEQADDLQKNANPDIYKPEVFESHADLYKAIVPKLKKFGLQSVGVKILDSIENGRADGLWANKIIHVAMDSPNPIGTMRHESVHALRQLGGFKPNEWTVLSKKAKDEWVDKFIKKPNLYKDYEAQYQKDYGNMDGFEDYIQEEAIAEAFKYFDQTKPPAGMVGNIYQRLKQFFETIRNGFQGNGFHTADSIFRSLDEGKRAPVSLKEKAVAERQLAPQYALNEKPYGIPQKIWDLHDKSVASEEKASNYNYGSAKRNQTMAFRRLNNAVVAEYGEENASTVMRKIATIRGIEQAIKDDDQSMLNAYRVSSPKEYNEVINAQQGKENEQSDKYSFRQFDEEGRPVQATPSNRAEAGELSGRGKLLGGKGRIPQPSRVLAPTQNLENNPPPITIPSMGQVEFGAHPIAREVANEYMADKPYFAATSYVKINPERAKRIANAYEGMKDEPNNPEVKASYDAMIKETLEQWQAIKKTGLKVEFMQEGMDDPYAESPRLAILDAINNNHLWVFPTDFGYGEGNVMDEKNNPLLAYTDEVISGKRARVNDIFRIVHDYFGHIKDGVGFRAEGEENAWRSHVQMYSPLARKAMTTEVRGQNSWVNFGPHAEFNRTANAVDTKYAPQKIGLLPDEFVYSGSPFETDHNIGENDAKKYSFKDEKTELRPTENAVRPSGGSTEGISLNARQPNAKTYVGYHYSKGERQSLDGSKYGSLDGIAGQEQKRLAYSNDPRIKKRIYFYIPHSELNGRYLNPEQGLGSFKHSQTFNNILGPGSELQRIYDESGATPNDMNKFESAVVDAGYDGYASPRMGMMVILNHDNVPVDTVGKLSIRAPLQNAFDYARGKDFKTNRELKIDLQKIALQKNKQAKTNIENFDNKTIEYLSNLGVADALHAIKTNENAVGWYDVTVAKALNIISLLHPEIKTDPDAKFAFTWALAVTSNGMKVDKNFELAEQAYNYYKKNGVMPTNIQAGEAQKPINKGLETFNDMVAKYGMDNTRKFMATEFTKKEIEDITGIEIAGENVGTKILGASIIGPKIGGGFYSNLNGIFDKLTMDRWLMRTWGRWTGTLIENNVAQIQASKTLVNTLLRQMVESKETKKNFEIVLKKPITKTELKTEEGRALLAKNIAKATVKPQNREIFNKTILGEKLRKASNNLAKYLDGQKEAPKTGTERNQIRAVFDSMLKKLQSRGYNDLTMADLQALLWYPERRLYDVAKESETNEGYDDSEAPDYANAAAKLVKENGVPETKVNQAIQQTEKQYANRARGIQPNAGSNAPQISSQGKTRGFTETERTDFAEKYTPPKPEKAPRVKKEKYSLRAPNTPAFRAWFKGSKVVDEDGKPQVVYHSTTNFQGNEFKISPKVNRTGNPDGFYFTYDIEDANEYAGNEEGSQIIPVYLNIKKPYDYSGKRVHSPAMVNKFKEELGRYFDLDRLGSSWVNEKVKVFKEGRFPNISFPTDAMTRVIEAGGYDGMKDGRDWVAFEPNQIKSAIGNRGTFDITSPDIRYSLPRLTKIEETKSSGKVVKDTAFQVWDNIHNDDYLTAKRVEWVDKISGLTKALQGLPQFDMNGKLRADLLLRAKAQGINLIKNGIQSGMVRLNLDGTLGVERSENNLARSMVLADELDLKFKQFGFTGRGGVAEVARILRGEDIMKDDASTRARGDALVKQANAHLKMASDLKTLHKFELEYAKNLNKEAKALYNAGKLREGNLKASEARRIYETNFYREILKETKEARKLMREGKPLQKVNRELQVTPAHIRWAHNMLARIPEIENVLGIWKEVNRGLVDLWVDTGLLNQETADKFKAKDRYVPLFKSREDLDNEGLFNSTGTGIKATAKIHALKGDTSERNIWENIDKHYAKMVAQAYENQTRRVGIEQLKYFQLAKDTTDRQKANIFYKEDGKEKMAIVENPNDLAAFQAMTYELSPLMKVFVPMTKILRTGALLNPMYWIKQLIRDPIHASLVANSGIITPFHSMVEFAQIIAKNSEEAKILANRGVIGPVDNTMTMNEFLNQVGKEKTTPHALAGALHKIMEIHEASDAATRVAIYKKAYAEGMKKYNDKEKATDFAVFKARESINFSVHGNSPLLQSLRASIPFFSAAITSLDTVYRAATGYGLNEEEKAQARRIFASRALMLAFMSTMYAMLYQDDEQYKKLPDYVKDENWLIPTPDGKTFIKIPTPYEVGFLFKTLPEGAVRYMAGTSTGKEVIASYYAGLLHNLPANGIPVPQAVKPILETITNHSFFTNHPIEGMSDQGLPVSMRGQRATEFSKMLSRFGLDGIGLSPAKIDNLFQGYFAELGTLTTGLASDITYMAEGKVPPAKNIENMTFMKSFLTDPNVSKAVSDFYSLEANAKQLAGAVNKFKAEGNIEGIQSILNDEDKKKAYMSEAPLRKIGEEMTKIRKAINFYKETQGIDPEERRRKINELTQVYNQIAESGYKVANAIGINR